MGIFTILMIFFIFYILFIYFYWNQIYIFLESNYFANNNVIIIKNQMRYLDKEDDSEINNENDIIIKEEEKPNIYMDKIRWIVKQPFEWSIWIINKYM